MTNKIYKGLTVKTTKKESISNLSIPPLLLRNRRRTEDSIVDSPIFLSMNKLWLVKHSKSGLVKGISNGYYAVYHENELEVVEPEVKAATDEDY